MMMMMMMINTDGKWGTSLEDSDAKFMNWHVSHVRGYHQICRRQFPCLSSVIPSECYNRLPIN